MKIFIELTHAAADKLVVAIAFPSTSAPFVNAIVSLQSKVEVGEEIWLHDSRTVKDESPRTPVQAGWLHCNLHFANSQIAAWTLQILHANNVTICEECDIDESGYVFDLKEGTDQYITSADVLRMLIPDHPFFQISAK